MNIPERKPQLLAPAGTCDTHVHFYSDRFPPTPTAWIKPPDATVEAYLAMCGRLGIERTVVVQPTTYGFDNRCILEAITALGSRARGIAVVDETVSDAELQRLTKAGIRGARFHMMRGGMLPWEALEKVAARVQAFGWLSQLQFDGFEFPERQALINRLPGTLVIDHMGRYSEPLAVDHPAFRALLKLVEGGRTYVKLSGAYVISKSGPPKYEDVTHLAKALVRAAPERLLWASDWPHPSAPFSEVPEDESLLDLLLDWAPDEAVRHKILVENPARLYGF